MTLRNLLAFSSTLLGALACAAEPSPSSDTAPPIPSFSTSSLDRSVEPAKDFYHFAAGNWVKNNPVPPDKSRWASFSELAERNWFLIHGILDQARANTSAAAYSPEGEVGAFYASAMDTNRIEQLRFQPIADELSRIEAMTSSLELFTVLAGFHQH